MSEPSDSKISVLFAKTRIDSRNSVLVSAVFLSLKTAQIPLKISRIPL